MKLTIAAITLGLVALVPGHVRAEAGETATMNATCDQVTFAVSGYPEGSMVMVWADSGMPYQFIVGQPAAWYTSEVGGGSGTVPTVGAGAEWDWAVDVALPDGSNVRPVSGHIDCTPAPAPAVESVPVTESAASADVAEVSAWAGVELAPPW